MKMGLRLLFIILLIGLGFQIFKLNKPQKEIFNFQTIQFDFPYHEEWEIDPLTKKDQEHLNTIILSQKFTYLGKGARLVAFLSEDGLYVLKFFKYRYHKPHWAVRFLPSIFPFENYRKRKLTKVSLETVINGYKVAYDYDRQGTGLLYIHLNPSPSSSHQLPDVTLLDKQGHQHIIHLDHTRFVIQLKVQELAEVLHKLLKNQEVALVAKRLCQVFDLYAKHYQKGLYDLGVGIIRNNGFIDDEPIHFDVGKMTFNKKICQPQFQKERMAILVHKVDLWLLKNYPLYRDEIMLALEKHVLGTGN
jgi:hypothetical protein